MDPLVAPNDALPEPIAVPVAWVMLPRAGAGRGPVTDTLPRDSARLLFRAVVPVPALVRVTFPLNAFVPVRAIAPLAVKSAPTAVMAVLAAWVMLPAAVTARFPVTFTLPSARARL